MTTEEVMQKVHENWGYIKEDDDGAVPIPEVIESACRAFLDAHLNGREGIGYAMNDGSIGVYIPLGDEQLLEVDFGVRGPNKRVTA